MIDTTKKPAAEAPGATSEYKAAVMDAFDRLARENRAEDRDHKAEVEYAGRKRL